MRTERPRHLLAALLSLAGLLVVLVAPAGSGATRVPQLRREGRWLLDKDNRIVLLHGVNAVWKRAPYVAPDVAEGFTAADADWLVANGFNTVRLGVLFVGVMPTRGVVDHAYLARADRVVRLLASRRIWVMIDFHQDMLTERFGGEGWPDWAVDSDGLPLPASLGFPGNYFTPVVSHAFDNVYADKGGVIGHYAAAWQAVARKWRDQPYLMGYDLMNEPWPGKTWPTCIQPLGCPHVDTQQLQPFQERVLRAIRDVDRDNIVWFEPHTLFGSSAPDWQGSLRPIGDRQLGFSFHDYCPLAALTHSYGVAAGPECPTFHGRIFDNAEQAFDRLEAAGMLSEFGASDDLPDIADVTEIADERLVSWQYWHYKEWQDPTTESQESGGQGLFTDDKDLRTVKQAKADILVRPYARAVAGVPTRMRWDAGAGVFELAYTARRATAPTEIFVPTRHFPKGYAVTVTGGRVVSRPDAALLHVVAAPGAAVSVRVSRR